MSPDVHLEGPQAGVPLVAVFAAEEPSCCCGLRLAVLLPVPGQAGESAVGLMAIQAGEPLQGLSPHTRLGRQLLSFCLRQAAQAGARPPGEQAEGWREIEVVGVIPKRGG